MLFSPTRPVILESSWVPGRLPRPTRHPIRAGVLLRMQDLQLATNDICIAAGLAHLR